MRRLLAGLTLALASAAASTPAAAQVLRFDDIPLATTGGVAVDDFYDGGGGAAFDYGVTFSGDALAFCLNRIGTPNCSNTSWGSDPGAIARGTEGAGLSINAREVFMNRERGFTTGFSFYFANPFGDAGRFEVWTGLNGTGTLLASRSMGSTPNGRSDPACFGANYCPFIASSVSFAGVARSVRFTTERADFIIYDDITLGSRIPGTVVPEPATVALMASGLIVLAGVARRRARAVA